MPVLTRRRMLAVAAAAACPLAPNWAQGGESPARWRGTALGARARIDLAGPRAGETLARCRVEIERLERIFSLRRPESTVSRLNAAGAVAWPEPDLLQVLSLAESVGLHTGGAFDPTVQPLWALHAEHFARPGADPDGPAEEAVARTRARTGWDGVEYGTREVRLARPGMALTLNGIAQGHVADRLTELLRNEGYDQVLVEAGEWRALGPRPDGTPWRVRLGREGNTRVPLANRALAVSAPLGTRFSESGAQGHILDPRSGRPGGEWRQAAVLAPRAALADALSTALCLLPEERAAQVRKVWPEAEIRLLPLA